MVEVSRARFEQLVADALDSLPDDRVPTKADWARLSRGWRTDLDARIEQLTKLRDSLDGCIGCGCLSLNVCPLINPDDRLAEQGPGPRILTQPDERPVLPPDGACAPSC